MSFGENKNAYIVAVAIALLFVSILLGFYLVTMRPPSNATMTIYLLDSQKKAANYPEILVINQNSTFNVWVEVENHVGSSQNFTVLMKVDNGSTSPIPPVNIEPTATYSGMLENGQTWEKMTTISINQAGNYSVVYELWVYDQKSTTLEFSNEYCLLNMQAIN